MKKLAIYTACLCLLLAISCSGPSNNEALSEQLDTLLAGYFNKDEPGGAVLIMKGDEVLYENGFGLADVNTKEAITPSTIFNTGSISKTFIGNGILILEEQNKLSIQDPIIKYFPDFKNKEIANKITLEHFLTHTSGIPDLRGIRDSTEYYLNADDLQNFKPLKEADSLHFEPGTQWQYSNPAYNGLAVVIENLTGNRWQDFIIKEIFEKSGMNESRITDGSFPDKDVAHGYWKMEDGSFMELDYGETPTFNAAGNGGIWCSVRDLAKYHQALKNGTFLKPQTIERAQSVYLSVGNTGRSNANLRLGSIGHSWFIQESDSIKYVGHTGSQGGFNADFLIMKDNDILYVLLCNTPKPIFEIRKEVMALLYKYSW